MKKTKFLALLLMAVFTMGFVCSCGDDDDDEGGSGGLSGYWMTEASRGWKDYDFCKALHFINGNTVDYYSYVANGKYWDEGSARFPGKSGWYYQDGCEERFSYYVEGNTIYLYNSYNVMTIDYYNGQPYRYSKVK